MLAVRTYAAGEPLRLEDVPVPAPRGTEVLVRVAGAGVCHTDLHIARTDRIRVDRPITLGHEVAGWIAGMGADAGASLRKARLKEDEPVVVAGGWGCGECAECRRGEEQRCEQSRAPGFQVDGGYAEYLLVPHPRHLVGLGKLDPVEAAPLADAGLTSFRAVRRAAPWLAEGSRALLIGLGGVGQFALQFIRRLPEVIIGVREIDPDKVQAAGELGADVAFLSGEEDLIFTGLGGPAQVVFDFVGSDETLALATRFVAPGGLVSLVGEAGGELTFAFEALPAEASLTTTSWGSHDDLRDVVQLARRHSLRWTVDRMPLAEAAAAHDRLAAGRVPGRLVLVP
ncbi:MAG TPA: alcohol dehydrogenase catalytic domain-containing protein [Candidatus Limnocylindria bacterium]|nr:alcohol dehydrogenase catalytic domain-containing protein [Candidatus Limnocylindria bacterium]